ncbi:MAG: D-alanyl-D-alanine carboxypeptidase [Pyrinomonadaceae bacterium]
MNLKNCEQSRRAMATSRRQIGQRVWPRVGRSSCAWLTRFLFCLLMLIGASSSPFAQQLAPSIPRVARASETAALAPLLKNHFRRAVFPDISAELSNVEHLSAANNGLLIETPDGRVVKELGAHRFFNPASTTKLATALVALKNLGPRFRFATTVWTNGQFDSQTGIIHGDLFVAGRDPALHDEHVVMIAQELNRLGITTVTGDLYVPSGFSLNFDSSALRAGDRFYDTLDATLRSPAAARAWQQQRSNFTGIATATKTNQPSVAVMGDVLLGAPATGARTLLTHSSSTLTDILKVILCYSNNFMADRLGDALGGSRGIERSLVRQFGVRAEEVKIASASGLGSGRVTPRAMMKIYRALLAELEKNKLSPSDIMPVAGVDLGTLQKRFTAAPSRASVIAKTGTLPRTDGGVCTLVGQVRARNGETLVFVIFNQRGNVLRFRQQQDALLTALQHQRGGPAPFAYQAVQLAAQLGGTQLVPGKQADLAGYEPSFK